ncbi:hypothetical protein SRHO_G00229380 [Serrasalmus rhombeus]|uniref:Ig-like domain-containing protein n=1 Tax=Pygocentrus nattereri TaxID=42514 RepID=A0A3B4DYC0_PYGNA|nr:hepatitis A virus cellular receptor 1 homolog [Pygocentrus nattereri]
MITSVIILTSGIFVTLHAASVLTVVGLVGETVTLPCKYDVKTHGISNICWGRGQSWFSCEKTLIATDGMSVTFRESYRYSLPSMLHMGNVSLTIKKAQNADTGFYTCRIEIPGLFNDLSSSVLLFVSNGLNPVNVITGTEPAVSAEKQVGTQDFTAEYSSAGSVSQLQNAEDTLEAFILTTLRVGAVIFIPGLIIALVWKLQRSRKHRDSSGKENVPTQQQNASPHVHTPVQTPHAEDN